jgi:hypothetical protein
MTRDDVGPEAEAPGKLSGHLVVPDSNRDAIPANSDDDRADMHDADDFAAKHAIELTEHGRTRAADRSNFDDNLATWSRT